MPEPEARSCCAGSPAAERHRAGRRRDRRRARGRAERRAARRAGIPLRGGKGVRLHHPRGLRYVIRAGRRLMGARRCLSSPAPPTRCLTGWRCSARRAAGAADRPRSPAAPGRGARSGPELAAALLAGARPGTAGSWRAARRLLGLGVEEPLHVSALRRCGRQAAWHQPPPALSTRRAPEAPRDRCRRRSCSAAGARARGEVEAADGRGAAVLWRRSTRCDLVVVAPWPRRGGLLPRRCVRLHAILPIDMGVGRAAPSLDGLPCSWLDARFAVVQLTAAPAPDEAGGGRSGRQAAPRRPPTTTSTSRRLSATPIPVPSAPTATASGTRSSTAPRARRFTPTMLLAIMPTAAASPRPRTGRGAPPPLQTCPLPSIERSSAASSTTSPRSPTSTWRRWWIGRAGRPAAR